MLAGLICFLADSAETLVSVTVNKKEQNTTMNNATSVFLYFFIPFSVFLEITELL